MELSSEAVTSTSALRMFVLYSIHAFCLGVLLFSNCLLYRSYTVRMARYSNIFSARPLSLILFLSAVSFVTALQSSSKCSPILSVCAFVFVSIAPRRSMTS